MGHAELGNWNSFDINRILFDPSDIFRPWVLNGFSGLESSADVETNIKCGLVGNNSQQRINCTWLMFYSKNPVASNLKVKFKRYTKGI